MPIELYSFTQYSDNRLYLKRLYLKIGGFLYEINHKNPFINSNARVIEYGYYGYTESNYGIKL